MTLPTIPIIDGVVKSPLAADAQLIRIIEGGTKQTGAYEAGAEIEVTHGTILELLANGNRNLMTVECVDTILVPVVEPEPIQEYPETDSVDRKSLTERVRIVANETLGKAWDDLTDKQKAVVLAIADPIVDDFLPSRGSLVMASEFEAAKSPVLREIETILGFRDPNKEYGGADIPEQKYFPKLTKSSPVLITNPSGAVIPDPIILPYTGKAPEPIILPYTGKAPEPVSLPYIPGKATPCTSDDSCTSTDDVCTGDDSCSVSDETAIE